MRAVGRRLLRTAAVCSRRRHVSRCLDDGHYVIITHSVLVLHVSHIPAAAAITAPAAVFRMRAPSM